MSIMQLYRLQLMDVERDERRRQLAEVEERLAATDELTRARDALAETEAELERMRSRLLVLDQEIAERIEKLKANQKRMYEGQITGAREAKALRQEADFVRKELTEREDEQLGLMIGLDETEVERAERQARLRAVEAEREEEQATLRAEQARLKSRIDELSEDIADVRSRTPRSELAEYDHLRGRSDGKPVARLRGGICQTCGVDVPTGVASAVERGEGLHNCPVCGRILFGG